MAPFLFSLVNSNDANLAIPMFFGFSELQFYQVPEPTNGLLMFVGAVALLRFRKK